MYYNLRLDWDPKVIGVKNGIFQVELDKNTYAKLESLFIGGEFTAKQEYPDEDFIFCFNKLKSAKKTSFISFTPYLKHVHFLVHKKTLELLKQFNIQKYKAYQSEIYDSLSISDELSHRFRFQLSH